MARQAKGSVAVGVDRGYLRLRWRVVGQRYTLALGLPDTRTNRAVAERKAKLIEQDIISERFDPTLERYRLNAGTVPVNGRNANGKNGFDEENKLTVADLFGGYLEWKNKELEDKSSLLKYHACLKLLVEYFGDQSVDLSEEQTVEFRDWLAKVKRLAPVTIRERMSLVRGCWAWGIRRKLVQANPWSLTRIKVPPQQKVKPFTTDEVNRIIAGFEAHPTYRYYTDFVVFLFAVGCRIGEAAGLRWRHLNNDCSEIWIGESYVRGHNKPTKTGTARWFLLSPKLQAMLWERKRQAIATGKGKPNDLVFPAKRGNEIDDKTFNRNAWKTVLTQVNVPYRKPRSVRHSFVSRAIDQGLSPADVAEITGHSEQVLFKSYLGSVKGKPRLPELD